MKKVFLPTLVFLLLTSLSPAQTVYITKSGTEYHSGGCSYLNKSSITIDLKTAVKKSTLDNNNT